MSEINLELFKPYVAGNGSLGDYTELLAPTWRRSIRYKGGYFVGTADIDTKQIDRDWLDELFTYGILSEVRETGGGEETWRGLISKMDYVRGGDQYTIDMATVANRVRSIYTRVFDNLITNGDAESGVWAAYHTPTTIAQYAGWKTSGNYSMRIVSSSDNGNVNGAEVAAVVAVTAGIAYNITANLRVISGSWRLSVNRADTDASLTRYSTHGVSGDHAVSISIPSSSTYTGNVDVRISSEGTAGVEIWVDDVQMAQQSVPARTGWQSDQASMDAMGSKEDILLEGGMSDAAANAHVLSQVRDRAWPQVAAPPQYQTRLDSEPGVDKLSITFAGYWSTLNWMYTRITGTAAVSTHIRNMLTAGLPYVQAGVIDANTLSYTIDINTPLRYGDVLREMSGVGEADGSTRWGIGVYNDRRLNYERILPEPIYTMRGGKVYDMGGAEVEPWLAHPGWCICEDMPLGPHASVYAQHDPRWQFFSEVEMQPDGKLVFNREAL